VFNSLGTVMLAVAPFHCVEEAHAIEDFVEDLNGCARNAQRNRFPKISNLKKVTFAPIFASFSD